MKLTGKCKEEFEKWYLKMFGIKKDKLVISIFYDLIPSMQYGVYVDYFDSVGVIIEINELNKLWLFFINDDSFEFLWEIKTRPQARTQAILKANEIRNEQLDINTLKYKSYDTKRKSK